MSEDDLNKGKESDCQVQFRYLEVRLPERQARLDRLEQDGMAGAQQAVHVGKHVLMQELT